MSNLIPVEFDAEARVLEWMDYICGTVHPQAFTRQFRPGNFAKDAEDEPRVVAQGKALAEGYLDVIENRVAGDPWLMRSGYSIADAALFFVTGWASGRSGITLPPKLAAHHHAMMGRPAVQRALAREALA